ncbi:MAG: hypothetical protein QGG48_11575, partial [Desulfatiglandales bacterium]|nr:hypothetical protein [Desulfatiglandales bacterium]
CIGGIFPYQMNSALSSPIRQLSSTVILNAAILAKSVTFDPIPCPPVSSSNGPEGRYHPM